MNVDLHGLGGRSLRLLATDLANTKEQSMKLRDWEQTIVQIVDQSNHEPKESGKSRVLMDWRAKLAREPHALQPFQIDEIVREVRKRLTNVSLQPTSIAPAPLALAASTVLA
jgi:hypothetical protein